MLTKHSSFMRVCLFSIAISLASCKGAAGVSPELDQSEEISGSQNLIEVPEIIHPTIDGSIDAGEWQSALVHQFSEGSEVYFIVDGDDLYLAMQNNGGGMIAGNVFLDQGDRVLVMHTSAALGTAIYQLEGQVYRKVQDFEWCCRSKIDDDASRAVRELFYDEEGWLGQNSFIGAENELEYKISLEEKPAKLAVNFILADGSGEKQVWPVGLEDGVSLPSSDGFPDLIEFSVEAWIALEEIR